MELLDGALDDLIEDKTYNLTDIEWISILFQICFGLAISQKYFKFVHNDLHSSNIMFKKTELDFLYYNVNNMYFKIPTYSKITKIIDFGRATFFIKNKIFFSDVFKKNGDAEGQYSYPYHNNITKNKVKTNYSFDLARLSTTIIEHFEEDSELFNFVKNWSKDQFGNCLIYANDDFDLYKNIAQNVLNSIPKKQLLNRIFDIFKIEKDNIPENTHIYKL